MVVCEVCVACREPCCMRTSDIGDSIHDKTFFLFVFVAISIVMLLLWGTPILSLLSRLSLFSILMLFLWGNADPIASK